MEALSKGRNDNFHGLSMCKSTRNVLKITPPIFSRNYGGCPRGVMVKAMDCGIVVSEFVLQSRYYVHFRANTLRKDMKPLILPAMG